MMTGCLTQVKRQLFRRKRCGASCPGNGTITVKIRSCIVFAIVIILMLICLWKCCPSYFIGHTERRKLTLRSQSRIIQDVDDDKNLRTQKPRTIEHEENVFRESKALRQVIKQGGAAMTMRNTSEWRQLPAVSRAAGVSSLCDSHHIKVGHYTKARFRPHHSPRVLPTHGLLFCMVPKVSSTTWKRVFANLEQGLNITHFVPAGAVHAQHDPQWLDQNITAALHQMTTYRKALFVRHPFERLLSAYRNKLETRKNAYFNERYGAEIRRRYHVLTFRTFVRYVIDDARRGRALNEHWATFAQLCHPCLLRYDFVGKLETLERDANDFLRHVLGVRQPDFPVQSVRTDAATVRRYFAEITEHELTDLHRVYKADFKLFSYPFWPTGVSLAIPPGIPHI